MRVLDDHGPLPKKEVVWNNEARNAGKAWQPRARKPGKKKESALAAIEGAMREPRPRLLSALPEACQRYRKLFSRVEPELAKDAC